MGSARRGDGAVGCDVDRAEPGASQAPHLADLYAAADVALYRAKVAGRGRVEVHAR